MKSFEDEIVTCWYHALKLGQGFIYKLISTFDRRRISLDSVPLVPLIFYSSVEHLQFGNDFNIDPEIHMSHGAFHLTPTLHWVAVRSNIFDQEGGTSSIYHHPLNELNIPPPSQHFVRGTDPSSIDRKCGKDHFELLADRLQTPTRDLDDRVNES